MKNIIFSILSIVMLFILSGCSGTVSNMQVATPGEIISSPKEGTSKIVFLRTNSLGFAIQSSIFKIKNNTPEIVGIVAAKKKMSYDINPGNYIFMVIGESADFMYAEIKENKTYYADITPRMGMWKARFSLAPISGEVASSQEFIESLNDYQLVIPNESTKIWAINNQESISSKYTEYYKKWMSKEENLRPKLLSSDGI